MMSRSSRTAAIRHPVQPCPRSTAASTTLANRGCSGRSAIARPRRVGRPSASMAPTDRSRLRASPSACSGGWSSRRQARRIRLAPHRGLEHETGEVHLGDLRIGVVPSHRVLGLGPQPHGPAGRGPTGPARPLVGGRPRDRDGLQARHAGPRVEARRAGQAAVHDRPHPLDGEAGLGDVGGQHDLAARRLRG